MKHFLTRSIEYTNLDPYYTPLNILKMTAVEYLIEQFKIYLPSIHQKGLQDTFEQALEMEKEQIIIAYKSDRYPCSDQDAEDYYNTTFKKD
jgi:hypothetical protein